MYFYRQQVHRTVFLAFNHFHTAAFRRQFRIDIVYTFFQNRLKQPFQYGTGHHIGFDFCQGAAVDYLYLFYCVMLQLIIQFAQVFAQRHELFHGIQFASLQRRKVYSIGYHFTPQRGNHFFCNGNTYVVLRFLCVGAQMGSQHALGQIDQRGDGLRFVYQHVDTGTGHQTFTDRFCQILFIIQTAAGAVYHANALLAFLPVFVGNHIHSLFGFRSMNGDYVGFLQQFVQRFTFLNIVFFEPGICNVRIVSNDLHAKGLHAGGNQTADAAQTDNAQGLAHQFHAFQAVTVPDTAFNHLMSFHRIAAGGQHQTDGVLGSGNDIGFRCIYDNDAPLCSAFHLDVIHTVTGTAYNLQVGCVFIKLFIDFRYAADNDGIVFGNPFQQFFPGEIHLHINLQIFLRL